MKHPLTLLLAASLFVSVFSCATAGGLRPAAGEHGNAQAAVTDIVRPDEKDASVTVDSLPLPRPAQNRHNAIRYLKAYAAHVSQAVRRGLESWWAELDRRRRNAARRADTGPVTRAPVREIARTAPVKPPVRRVVNTPAPEAASSRDPARTIFARQGDDIEISFRENGWLCLELPPEGSGLDYLSRTIEGNKTLFKFRGRRIGEYSLPFQYQDNTRGIIKRETIDVKVVAEKEFDAAMGARGRESEDDERKKRRAYALKLYDLGNFSQALQELLASYAEGDPELNHLIASLALREKDYKNAVLFWTKNLGEKKEWRDKAILGLIRASAGLGDRRSLAGLIRAVLTVKNLPTEEELGILIRMLDDLQDHDLAYRLLAAYQFRYPTGSSLAEVYFRLGQLHELVAAYLDFKKAREYYGRVVKEFPESPYYGPARERIAYINRHYFRVQ